MKLFFYACLFFSFISLEGAAKGQLKSAKSSLKQFAERTWNRQASRKINESWQNTPGDISFNSIKEFFMWLVMRLMPPEEYQQNKRQVLRMNYTELLSYIHSHQHYLTNDIRNTQVRLSIPPALDGKITTKTDIFLKNIGWLKDLVSFTGLSLHMNLLGDEDVKNIKLLEKLEYLDLRVNRVRNLESLMPLPHLKTLAISFPKEGTRNLKPLLEMPQLKELCIVNSRLTQEEMSVIGKLHQVEVLLLPYNSISDEEISEIAALKNLKVLDLSRNNIGLEGSEILAGFLNLEFLNMTFNRLGDKGILNLTRLPHLKFLDVRKNHMTEAGYEFLEKMRKEYEQRKQTVKIVYNISLNY